MGKIYSSKIKQNRSHFGQNKLTVLPQEYIEEYKKELEENLNGNQSWQSISDIQLQYDILEKNVN